MPAIWPMKAPNAAMKAPASRLISASASNMAVIGGAPSSAPHASGKYMVLIHQTGGRGSSPSTPKALARRGHRVCRVNRVGSERKASYSSALRYSSSTHWNWTSSRQVAAGPADLLGAQRLQGPGRRNGHAGRPVPAEAERGIPQTVEVQLWRRSRRPCRRRLPCACGSTRAPGASAGRGPACARRPRLRTASDAVRRARLLRGLSSCLLPSARRAGGPVGGHLRARRRRRGPSRRRPCSVQTCSSTGEPPIMILTWSRRPAAAMPSMVSFIESKASVSRPERPTTWAPCS